MIHSLNSSMKTYSTVWQGKVIYLITFMLCLYFHLFLYLCFHTMYMMYLAS